jgi:hypothetical protein
MSNLRAAIIFLAAAVAACQPSFARIVGGETPEGHIANARRQLVLINSNLISDRNALLQVLSDIACDVDPPDVAKVLAENQQLRDYRAYAASSAEIAEQAEAQLAPNSPRVQYCRMVATRWQRRAEEYESELRARTREWVVKQYTDWVAGLESRLDQNTRELEKWTRIAKEAQEATSRSTTVP